MSRVVSKVVVTGGGGFLGRALALKCAELGHQVVSIARGDYPELKAAGIETVRADLREGSPVLEAAVKGAEVCFHTASKVEMWGPYSDFYAVNVLGTRNILRACSQERVPYFVYTSSPSVVAEDEDLKGINEDKPYSSSFLAPYPKTKALAEQDVLAANGNSIKTLALRPHLIWGPGDRHLVPTILSKAQSGKLIRVGSGKNLVDTSYIEDCVEAHLCAWRALASNPDASGQAYFISQGQPVSLWGWIDDILRRNNLPAVRKSIPVFLAKNLAFITETISNFTPGHREPLLTRFLVSQMSHDHYFDLSKAKSLLGYKPRYSIEEALQKTFG